MSFDRDELVFAISDPAQMTTVQAPRILDESDEKHSERVLNLSKKRLPLIAPVTFENGYRDEKHVQGVSMLGLDLDVPTADPAATIARVQVLLGGVEIYAYSTARSAPGAFKLRGLVPYDVPASGPEHRASWPLVERMLARGGVEIDHACSDPCRAFFVWSVPPSGAYYHAHLPGEPWPVALAAEVEAERVAEEDSRRAREVSQRAARRPASSTSTVERARRYVAAMPPAISGAGGHAATFNVARRLVADFELHDADAWDLIVEYNGRAMPPWSERELRHKLVSAGKSRVRVDMVTR
jgi:hypothetical protein